MGGEVIGSDVYRAKRSSCKKGLKFDEKADAEIENQQISHDKGSKALRATSVISDDGIIDPRDTRNVLGCVYRLLIIKS